MEKKIEIRNSTAEFLTFVAEGKEDGVQVMCSDESIWCTQDAIAELFDKGRSTIAEHLSNIFNEGELQKESDCRKFRRTAADGKEYNTQFYNLDAIISVGYRVNSVRGRRRINRAIFVKLISWLKLNVNNLKSAIWVKQRKITENIRKGMTSGWLGTSVGNYRFCFPEFPTNLRTLNGLNSIILSLFGMCK